MEKNQTPIICDVNIWYRISDGRISAQDIAGKRLVGTYINCHEFCSSPNAYKNYKLLRDAVIAFDKNAAGFCVESPIEYMKLVSGHDADDSEWKEINKALGVILEMEQIPDPELTRRVFREYVDEAKQNSLPFVDVFNEYRSQIQHKREFKKEMNKIESRYEHKEQTKKVIANLVHGLPLKWELLELYLAGFDEWIRQMSLQPSLTMTPSDWNDLSNLIYVQPGSLYWTYDEKKTKEFIRSSGYGHYLLS